VENDNGISKLTYHGAQSTNCCLVAEACLTKETEALETVCFCRILDCMLGIQNKGPKKDRDEPAIPPQQHKVVCCGDMAFQQKYQTKGVPAKAKSFFAFTVNAPGEKRICCPMCLEVMFV